MFRARLFRSPSNAWVEQGDGATAAYPCRASRLLLFTYVMSGTASVCAFYALFSIVIIATWRTSSWIGADGLIAGYRQRRHDHKTPSLAPVVTGAAEHAKAA